MDKQKLYNDCARYASKILWVHLEKITKEQVNLLLDKQKKRE